jgi:hypothetical protein
MISQICSAPQVRDRPGNKGHVRSSLAHSHTIVFCRHVTHIAPLLVALFWGLSLGLSREMPVDYLPTVCAARRFCGIFYFIYFNFTSRPGHHKVVLAQGIRMEGRYVYNGVLLIRLLFSMPQSLALRSVVILDRSANRVRIIHAHHEAVGGNLAILSTNTHWRALLLMPYLHSTSLIQSLLGDDASPSHSIFRIPSFV